MSILEAAAAYQVALVEHRAALLDPEESVAGLIAAANKVMSTRTLLLAACAVGLDDMYATDEEAIAAMEARGIEVGA